MSDRIGSPVFFLHIPKTAGTSFKHFLFNRFPAEDCLMDPTGPAAEATDLERYALVAGHLDYDFVRRYRQPPFVITSLRDPVDRALSAYYYHRSRRLEVELQSMASTFGPAVAERLVDERRRAIACETPAEFLRREPELAREHLGNVQTRFLAGEKAVAACADQPQQLLAIALEHLESVRGVLLTERLDESWAGVAHELGWEEPGVIPRMNTTPNRRAEHEHAPVLLEALAELTSLDAALYRAAEQRMATRIRSDAQSPSSAAGRDPLPAAADFTFEQPIRGSGWHVREAGPQGWYCWTAERAVLRLAFTSSGDHSLRIQVEHASGLKAWRGLQVSVNGQVVAIVPERQVPPTAVEATVPAQLLAGSPEFVEIGFRVPGTVCPAERDPDNPDTRRLGVAVSRVQLQPCRSGN